MPNSLSTFATCLPPAAAFSRPPSPDLTSQNLFPKKMNELLRTLGSLCNVWNTLGTHYEHIRTSSSLSLSRLQPPSHQCFPQQYHQLLFLLSTTASPCPALYLLEKEGLSRTQKGGHSPIPLPTPRLRSPSPHSPLLFSLVTTVVRDNSSDSHMPPTHLSPPFSFLFLTLSGIFLFPSLSLRHLPFSLSLSGLFLFSLSHSGIFLLFLLSLRHFPFSSLSLRHFP